MRRPSARSLPALLGPAVGAVVLALLASLWGSAPAATAAEPGVATLTLTVPLPTYAGQPALLTANLSDADGQPLVGVPVTFERRQGAGWVPLGQVATDQAGAAPFTLTMSRVAAENQVRALAAGSVTAPAVIELQRRASALALSAPAKVVDETSVRLGVTWKAANGEPVSGPVTVMVKPGKQAWRRYGIARTNAAGTAVVVATPRVKSQWRISAGSLDWVAGSTSTTRTILNVAPGQPVRLPKKAPKPKKKVTTLPRAVGAGANPVIVPIPGKVWKRMTGRSYHRGCPVGRADLRLISINYWDYTGYRRRGQMVVNSDVARQVSGALAAMYRAHLPIRSMVLVDRFGWSGKLKGANDYRSMAAGNSSAFNCRWVVGRPGVRSPHSWGRAVDLNTWENPYHSAKGVVPNRWWARHANKRVAWRSATHPVVQIMRRYGLRWTYGTADSQHFDAVPTRPATARSGNPPTPPIACGQLVCD